MIGSEPITLSVSLWCPIPHANSENWNNRSREKSFRSPLTLVGKVALRCNDLFTTIWNTMVQDAFNRLAIDVIAKSACTKLGGCAIFKKPK